MELHGSWIRVTESVMKVFVPVSDDLLSKRGADSSRLVPFNPEYLAGSKRQGRKPANWISDSDYGSACKRLRESQFESELSPA